MRAGVIFLNMTNNNFSHCWRQDTLLFSSKHLNTEQYVCSCGIKHFRDVFPFSEGILHLHVTY